LDTKEVLSSNNDIEALIREFMLSANTSVYQKSLEDDNYSGMGTTLIMAVFLENMLYVGHVGDSRLYHIRNGSIKQITIDHSYVEELIKNGTLTREQGLKHPKKNVITRALGCLEKLEIDTYKFEIAENDLIVMCTDGLTNMLDEEAIKCVVLDSQPQEVCEKLVFKALENGGEDNITVIVIKNG
jgi:protein phosphatase